MDLLHQRKLARGEYLKRYSKGSIAGQIMRHTLHTNWHICRPAKLKQTAEPLVCAGDDI